MHCLEFIDQNEADPKNLIAIGRDLRDNEKLELAFESLIKTSDIVYNKNNVGILIRKNGQPSFIV